jgi:hypothetical protein
VYPANFLKTNEDRFLILDDMSQVR